MIKRAAAKQMIGRLLSGSPFSMWRRACASHQPRQNDYHTAASPASAESAYELICSGGAKRLANGFYAAGLDTSNDRILPQG